MAPQGLGAACMMRLAGSITDRTGPRRIVPAGILIMAAATIPFAFETVHTPEVLLAGTLFLRGLGLGLTMMPITAAAYFNLSHADVPRASTTINIVRQRGRVGGGGSLRRRPRAPDHRSRRVLMLPAR